MVSVLHGSTSVAGLAFFLVASTRVTPVICSVFVIMSSVDSSWRVFDRC